MRDTAGHAPTHRLAYSEDEGPFAMSSDKFVLHGDVVGGGSVVIGNIGVGQGISVGRSAQARVTQGVSGEEIASLFEVIYEEISKQPIDSQAAIAEPVDRIRREVLRGDEASPRVIEYMLQLLARLSPPTFEVAVRALLQPAIATPIVEVVAALRNRVGTGVEQPADAGYESLIAEVTNLRQPTEVRSELLHSLEVIRDEVDKGDAADVREARLHLTRIRNGMPELRKQVWSWLRTNQVSLPIQILASQTFSDLG
jgi:hypothetical protein